MKKKITKIVTRIQNNIWYASLFVMLALLSLGLLAYENLVELDEKKVTQILEWDIFIAYFFLLDFILGLFFNRRYGHRDHRHHLWFDLLASIPVGLELVRVFRILRIFRAVRVVSYSIEFYLARRKYNNIKQ